VARAQQLVPYLAQEGRLARAPDADDGQGLLRKDRIRLLAPKIGERATQALGIDASNKLLFECKIINQKR